MKKVSGILVLIVASSASNAALADVEQQIAQIKSTYDAEWAAIKAEGDNIKDDAPEGPEVAVGVNLDCEMKRNEIKLDIPEVAMKTNNMSLHVPQVTMKTQSIVWDNPETYVDTTICGYYPEFHGLRVTLSPIKCDLPQVRMVRREAKIDVPEFRWDRTDFSMDIPEVKMETQRWVFDLPACKVQDVSVETAKIQARSNALEERATNLAARQKADINSIVVAELMLKRNELDASFRDGITKIGASIDQIKGYGIDPTNVKQQDGSTVNLVAKMSELQGKREAELAKLDGEIQKYVG